MADYILSEKEYEEWKGYHMEAAGVKTYQEYLDDTKKECIICGSRMAIFEVRQINDSKYEYLHKPILVLCHMCLNDKDNFVGFFNEVL